MYACQEKKRSLFFYLHKEIEKEGRDAFYVFDCLSELQIAWATDLMMGNMFCRIRKNKKKA